MTNIFKNIFLSIALVGVLCLGGMTATASAACATAKACAGQGVDQVGGNNKGNNASDFTKLIKNIINVLLFLIGAIAVIMIIIGGLRYVTSAGDASQTKAAKDTILYSIVGLVIAIMSYAIVQWVIDKL